MIDFQDKIIAHRGASAYAPENTLAAFNKALFMGARCIEFDVICSQDGEPFVFHDENLKRTSNGKGDFGKVDAAYLETLDAGRWFSRQFANEKIPHFREVLEWLSFSGLQANIEIKPFPGTTEQTTISILRLLNRFWPQGKGLPLISSFDYAALQLCQAIAPEMPLGLLVDSWTDDCLKEAEKYGCMSIHVNRRSLSAERVKSIKEAGFKVYAYTVNRKRLARKLLDWGVDAIFSDYPDLLS